METTKKAKRTTKQNTTKQNTTKKAKRTTKQNTTKTEITQEVKAPVIVEASPKKQRAPRQKLNIAEAFEKSTFLNDMLAIVTEAGFYAEERVKSEMSEAYKRIYMQMMPSHTITLKGEKDFMVAAIQKLVDDGKMQRTRTHGVVYCHVQPLPQYEQAE